MTEKRSHLVNLVMMLCLVIGFGGQVRAELPVVQAVYISPSDRQVRNDYTQNIRTAIESLQAFYFREMNLAHRFNLADPVVDVIESDQEASWFGEDMWGRAINEAQAEFYNDSKIWIIWVDADQACGSSGVGGVAGIAVMPANDLRGLAGEPTEPDCGGFTPNRPVSGWIGGAGHELGHALGLPHPPGCDAGAETCDDAAIMWLGFNDYPDTHLTALERRTLSESSNLTRLSQRIEGQWVDERGLTRGGNRQGITFDYLELADVLFMTWYTFVSPHLNQNSTSDGEPLGAADNRWLTAQLTFRGSVASGPLFRSTGGEFNAPPTGAENAEQVGEISVDFLGCLAAELEYSFDVVELSGLIPIMPLERILSPNISCNELP